MSRRFKLIASDGNADRDALNERDKCVSGVDPQIAAYSRVILNTGNINCVLIIRDCVIRDVANLILLKLCELGANISYSTFDAVDLSGIDFRGLYVCNTKFTRAKLALALFDRCYIYDSVFENVNMQFTSFRGTHITRTDFNNAKIRYACFDEVDFGRGRVFATRIYFASFYMARFNGTHIYSCNINKSNFAECLFLNTYISSSISSSKFIGSTMERVNFVDSRLNRCDLQRIKCVDVNFAGAILRNIDADDADLGGEIIDKKSLLHGDILVS